MVPFACLQADKLCSLLDPCACMRACVSAQTKAGSEVPYLEEGGGPDGLGPLQYVGLYR